jgi:hypothetical protein
MMEKTMAMEETTPARESLLQQHQQRKLTRVQPRQQLGFEAPLRIGMSLGTL